MVAVVEEEVAEEVAVVVEVQLFSLQVEEVVAVVAVVEVGTSQGRNIHLVLHMVQAYNHL